MKFTIGIAGIFVSIIAVLFLVGSQSVQSVEMPDSVKPANTNSPISIRIPKINVNANLESVGLKSDGSMAEPKDPTQAAWFNLGPRPGESGNAVINGHFGWKNNISAVFDDLSALSVGDTIYTEDDKGIITTFEVREVRMFKETEDSSSVFGIGDGNAHLNLITCGGVWNKTSKSYSNRLVVFTNKIKN
ncbi:class F sortase [Candidatus Parcubacteria bacterium]|nr:class F sortase [Candidatus Parcubacteria bacterium]